MKTSRRSLLRGLIVAPLLGAAAVKASTPTNHDPTMEPEYHDFPSGCLIVVAGGVKSGKSLLMNNFLMQAIRNHRTTAWFSKRYDQMTQKELVGYRQAVMFFTEGVWNRYQLQDLKEFAVRHQCCVVVEYQTARDSVHQIHDSICWNAPSPVLFIPDVIVWMSRETMVIRSDLKVAYFPVVVKNRYGSPKNNLPFELHDVMTVSAKRFGARWDV